ncbi:Protein kinase domain [Dillenia turbinata]|uniref:Protein kinase domain n=1 Tax=Dillenia turbinata TaxID=194707 RepID=A0AAN8UV05_9MAGN
MEEFDYEELREATENFSPTRLIGKGSHGSIYKATLKDGNVVAIKRASHDNSRKLENEAFILSSLPRMPSLIQVIGTSHDFAMKKLLVMEFMPNGSLEDLLHTSLNPPTWPKRVEMILQIAEGIHVLHQARLKIIHRDIKSANVLFDSCWNPKLADFSLAIMQNEHDDCGRVKTQPAGTIGYLDPSYTSPCKLSTKNDVYSFGVLVLEIISCRRAIDVLQTPASIVEWAMPLIQLDRMVQIFDPRIPGPGCMADTLRCMLYMAARCLSLGEKSRPSIGDIIVEIQSCLIQRVKFPTWTSIGRSLILLRKRKMIRRRHGTTVTCAAQQGDVNADLLTPKKALLREILADVTLN